MMKPTKRDSHFFGESPHRKSDHAVPVDGLMASENWKVDVVGRLCPAKRKAKQEAHRRRLREAALESIVIGMRVTTALEDLLEETDAWPPEPEGDAPPESPLGRAPLDGFTTVETVEMGPDDIDREPPVSVGFSPDPPHKGKTVYKDYSLDSGWFELEFVEDDQPCWSWSEPHRRWTPGLMADRIEELEEEVARDTFDLRIDPLEQLAIARRSELRLPDWLVEENLDR